MKSDVAAVVFIVDLHMYECMNEWLSVSAYIEGAQYVCVSTHVTDKMH